MSDHNLTLHQIQAQLRALDFTNEAGVYVHPDGRDVHLHRYHEGTITWKQIAAAGSVRAWLSLTLGEQALP